MLQIKLGAASTVVPNVVEALKAEGPSASVNETGEITGAGLKFPGVVRTNFTRQDLSLIIGALKAAPKKGGGTPGEVFQQTASYDAEGNLTAQFSVEKGARSVTLSPEAREDLVEYLASLLVDMDEKWPGLVAEHNKAEAEKKAKLIAEGKDPNNAPRRGRPPGSGKNQQAAAAK